MTLTVRKVVLCQEQITLRQKLWQLLRKLKSLLCQWALLATDQDPRQRNQKSHRSRRVAAVGNLRPIFLSKGQYWDLSKVQYWVLSKVQQWDPPGARPSSQEPKSLTSLLQMHEKILFW